MKSITSFTRRGLMAIAAASMLAGAAPAAFAQDVTIPIIVKDTTSFYWQIVLAGARKAGKDLGVNVPELGAQSEADINGQISHPRERRLRQAGRHRHLADRVQGARQADRRSCQVTCKIIGIDSGADSKAFTSFLTTDNVQGGAQSPPTGWPPRSTKQRGKVEGDVALITALPGVGSLDQRREGFKEQIAAKYPGLKLVADKYADGQATTGLNIDDRPDHRQPEPRGRLRVQPDHGAGRRPGDRRKQARRQDQGSSASTATRSWSSFLKDGVHLRPRRPGPLPHGL